MMSMLGRSKVQLYPTRARALAAKRSAAKNNEAFGIDFTTPLDFAGEVWDLFGDGRNMVSPLVRTLLIFDMLEDHGFARSVGTARLLASFVRQSLGRIEADAIPKDDLTASERALIDLVHTYREKLNSAGLCEEADLLDAVRTFGHHWDLSFGAECLLDGMGKDAFASVLDKRETRADDVDIPPDEPTLRYLLPQGPLAIDAMIVDEVVEAIDDGFESIAVCVSDPLESSVNMSAYVGTRAEYFAQVKLPLTETVLGKACFAASALLQEGTADWQAVLFDFALNPYAAIKSFTYEDIYGDKTPWAGQQTMLRAADVVQVFSSDRTLRREDALAFLVRVSVPFRCLKGLMQGNGCDAKAFIEDAKAVIAQQFPERERLIEFAALGKLSDLIDELWCLERPEDVALFFPEISVSVSWCESDAEPASAVSDTSGPRAKSHVVFVALDSLDDLSPASFDEVIIGDVSDTAFNAKQSDAALGHLLERFGMTDTVDALTRTRFCFFCGARSARRRLVCCLPLRNAEKKTSYPSFCFEELVDERSGGTCAAAQLYDHETLMREAQLDIRSRGESELTRMVGQKFAAVSETKILPMYARGHLYESAVTDHLRRTPGEAGKYILSPSAMEAYVSCPYRWFIERVVKLEDVVEGFGALERGSFAHRVFEVLYRSFAEFDSSAGLAETDIAQVRERFEEVFDRVLAEQTDKRPLDARYIPLTKSEWAATMRLKEDLWNCVLSLRSLPKEFSVMFTEADLASDEDHLVDYAGYALTGRIDRVDSDGSGTYYVLDYKGSVTGYDAGGAARASDACDDDSTEEESASDLPRHVQALVYAQALKRGLLAAQAHCIGALYVRYMQSSTSRSFAGSVASDVPALTELVSAHSYVHGDFDRYLDDIEEKLACRLYPLSQSRIDIEPVDEHACAFCPYLFCEGRR